MVKTYLKENGLRIFIYLLVIALIIVFARRTYGQFLTNVLFINSGKDLVDFFDFDARGYITCALNIIAGNGFSVNQFVADVYLWDVKRIPGVDYYPTMFVSPLYPTFLAVCFKLFGVNFLAFSIPQVILVFCTGIVIYLIGRKIYSKEAGIIAGLLTTIIIFLSNWPYVPYNETGNILIFSLVVYFLTSIISEPDAIRNYAFAGFFLGVSLLWKPILLMFLVVVIFWLCLLFWNNKKRLLKGIGVLSLVYCLTLVPWSARNYVVFDVFTPIPTEGGSALWHANNPSLLDVSLFDPFLFFNFMGEEHEESEKYLASFESQMEAAKHFISENPDVYLILAIRRCMAFWSPYIADMKLQERIIGVMVYVVVFPLAFWGMYLSWREKRRETLLLYLMILYILALHTVVNFSSFRFRLPIEPYLTLFAAFAYCRFFEKLKGKKEEKTAVSEGS